MKKSELRQLIREEIRGQKNKVIRQPIDNTRRDRVNTSLKLRGKKVKDAQGKDTGFKFGEKVNYKGRTKGSFSYLLVLDRDKNPRVPQGITLRLIEPTLDYEYVGVTLDLVSQKG
tara:strand:+ start:1973 stop:2317 length:345 start_codon:yes stop_codon:yes gene_type:complete